MRQCAPATTVARRPALISYRVRLADLDRHLFEIECRVDDPEPEQRFSLPAWIPGSYLLREFARFVVGIEASSAGQSLPVEKVESSAWVVRGAHAPLTLTTKVYALDQSVRGAYLDRRRGYFNGPCVFLLPEGRDPERIEVLIYQLVHIVEGGRTKKISKRRGDVVFIRELIDKIGVDAARWYLVSRGHDQTIDIDVDLEHRASTSLIFSRDDLLKAGDSGVPREYQRFLALASHEYFHTWHVKRTKPVAFIPYRLDRRVHTRLLWVFEGLTSYYQELMLLRSGVIGVPAFFRFGSQADVLLHPIVREAHWAEFYSPDKFIKMGEEKTLQQLDDIKRLLTE